MSDPVILINQNIPVASIAKLETTIEPDNDVDMGVPALAYKDSAGVAHVVQVKGTGGSSDLSEGGTKLKRVSDGEWVTASEGVPVFSPDQHGGIYGKVIRQYFPSGVTNGQVIQADVSRIVLDAVQSDDGTSVYVSPMFTTSIFARVRIEKSTDELEMAISAGQAVLGGYADYTLITPPSTSPWPQ